MGQRSIIYGCIVGPFIPNKLAGLNREVLNSLPEEDEWPFLTRNMFSIVEGYTYDNQIIRVGTSLKAVEYEWNEWLAKFEGLLRRLCWTNAYLHLVTVMGGPYAYHWEAQDYTEAVTASRPIARWNFEGGPREF